MAEDLSELEARLFEWIRQSDFHTMPWSTSKAAKAFNCTGAHQMGDKWMPCKSHDAHEEIEKHGGHHHH